MRRADRLFQIVQHLRSGKLITARTLAERLEVSERTIYRDMADLQGSGVPIDGEAGIGYMMRQGYDLPPLMFTREEMSALVIGARIVRAWGGARMALSAEDAISKIESVLPQAERSSAADVRIYAYDYQMQPAERANLDLIDTAIKDRKLLVIDYSDASQVATVRTVEPLGLFYWGRVWTLVGWCRLRSDFRMFRLDRIEKLTCSPDGFDRIPGRTIQDFLSGLVNQGFAPPPDLEG
ncbi:MAG: YafY family protein [Rhizobiaceae bacterium]